MKSITRKQTEISIISKYSIVGSNEFAIIATTRPETMLGDTALCVHPKDDTV